MRKNVKALLCMGLAVCLGIGSTIVSFAQPLLYTEPDDLGSGESINYCDYGYYNTIKIPENTTIYVTDDSGATVIRINPVSEESIDGVRMWWPDKVNEFPFENGKKYSVADYADGHELVAVEIGNATNYATTFWSLQIVKNAGTWANNDKGWWIEYADGSYLKDAWYQSPYSGLWYYMGSDGYMLTNTTTPDGYKVDGEGVWIQ